MHAALDGLMSAGPMAGGCCWASGWPGPTVRREGFVDGWMGVSKPAETLQFAYLNEVSDDEDIFMKNIKME